MNTIRGLQHHLELFQQTFTNGLTEGSPMANQPSHIQTPLRIHQLAAIYSMREKEIHLPRGFQISGQNTLFSHYGILGDRVGVGKTLTALGHISQMATYPLTQNPHPLSNLHPESSAACFSIAPHQDSQHIFDSLIVVPHTIYKQWQDSIEKQTTLKVHFLKSQRDVDKDSLLTSLQGAHCTLISNTLLSSFLTGLRARELSFQWRRVFLDEADSIKITGNCPRPLAQFTWYITASYSNILFENTYYHSFIIRQLQSSYLKTFDPDLQNILKKHGDSHPSVHFFKTKSPEFLKDHIRSQHPLRGHLVVRSSSEFLNKSIELPPLIQRVIHCLTPPSQQLLGNMIPSETEAMLNAGDIQGALQSLSLPSHTPLTIVEAVTEYRQRELERLKRLLAFKQEEIYASPQTKESAIRNLEQKITCLEQEILGIRKRIQEATHESTHCSICFDSPAEPVLTPCCSKMFCGSCILSWMVRSPACPLCRVSFHPSELRRISASASSEKTNCLPKKMDALLQIFQENPTGRFLIFSRYENPLLTLHDTIEYSSATLQGNKDAIAKTVADFELGHYKILLLNSRQMAAGMNLPSASHVILLHKMGIEEEQQILGRAYRLGRTGPLQFIKLLHERE